MQPARLKCPNCGAPISPQTMRCKYCGTHLTFRDNVVALKSSYKCPECGASIGTGSFICTSCGKVLTTEPKELSILRAEQKRIRFFHDKRLNRIPNEVRLRLEPDEYVYSDVAGKEGVKYGKKKQFIVTDRRIIVYHEKGIFSKTPSTRQVSYDDIVAIDNLDEVGIDTTVVVVQCFNENNDVIVSFPLFSSDAEDFTESAKIAFDNHRLQRKDITALLCFANI